jgi:hypothetical protein
MWDDTGLGGFRHGFASSLSCPSLVHCPVRAVRASRHPYPAPLSAMGCGLPVPTSGIGRAGGTAHMETQTANPPVSDGTKCCPQTTQDDRLNLCSELVRRRMRRHFRSVWRGPLSTPEAMAKPPPGARLPTVWACCVPCHVTAGWAIRHRSMTPIPFPKGRRENHSALCGAGARMYSGYPQDSNGLCHVIC